MSLGLPPPAAVPVEVRSGDRRVVRLSREIGAGGVRLVQPVPFEPGRPVDLRFCLPGDKTAVTVTGEVVATGAAAEQEGERGGCGVDFLDPSLELRAALTAYIVERLGLPPL